MKLIFIYNADSGKLNGLQGSLHKLISPSTYSCKLCQFTHSFFSEKKEWRQFLDSLELTVEFYHRNDYRVALPDYEVEQLPVVLAVAEKGVEAVVTAEDFSEMVELKDIIDHLRKELRGK